MQILNNEADRIYFAIFRQRIPETVRRHFQHVSKKIESCYPEIDLERYYHYISNVNDLEALEVAARHLKKIPVLTDKFRTMIYIAETIPENYHIFISEKSGRITAYATLVFSLIISCYKLVKGMILLAANR